MTKKKGYGDGDLRHDIRPHLQSQTWQTTTTQQSNRTVQKSVASVLVSELFYYRNGLFFIIYQGWHGT